MLLRRRETIAGCAGCLTSLLISPAIAQAAYPSRTIKMIVPYPAGGTTLALEPLTGSTPDSFASYVKTEVDRWAVVVKASGAEAE